MNSVSVVIPCYNEEDGIPQLKSKLLPAIQELRNDYDIELIFIDDGSRDGTPRLLSRIYESDSRVKVITLRRNFGQTAALKAGFDAARGDIVISMDGDLQHEPEQIPAFVDKLEEGYDIVSGWRAQRQDTWLTRRLPSRVANWAMAKLAHVPLHDFGTTFKAYRREILGQVPLYGELHRFIPALASWHGASIIEVPIKNVNRERGASHYGISRTFRVFFDLITIRFLLKYLSRPLHFFGTLGALGMFTGTGMAAWLLILKVMTGQHIMSLHGPLFVIAGVLILAGIQIMGIGLLGELQVRHFYTASHRAPYAVDRIIRLRSEESLTQ